MRFYAGCGAPPRGDGFFSVAHFNAAAMRQGLMAMAITSRGGDGLQASRHIAKEGNDREQGEDEYGGQANTEGSVSNDREKQRVHTSYCGGSEEKPIARESYQKSLLRS